MKKITILLTAVLFTALSTMAQVAINKDGTDPNASTILDVKATDAGFLPPRMTEAQMNTITSPAAGLMIFCTDCVPKSIRVYNGNHWVNANGVPDLEDGEVYNPATDEIWKDRNLGASQVATSSTDINAYGDLYQWGRLSDGHEDRGSATSTSLSSTDVPGHNKFILAPSYPYDWRSPQNNNLWQGESGTNNPCPSGFRIATNAEWNAERLSWAANNDAGAFGSPLKLTVGGYRLYSSGSLGFVGSNGHYWSSTVAGTYAFNLGFSSTGADMNLKYRAFGFSVRCIKD